MGSEWGWSRDREEAQGSRPGLQTGATYHLGAGASLELSNLKGHERKGGGLVVTHTSPGPGASSGTGGAGGLGRDGLRVVSCKPSFLCPEVVLKGTVSIPSPSPDSRGPSLAWARPRADGSFLELRLSPSLEHQCRVVWIQEDSRKTTDL